MVHPVCATSINWCTINYVMWLLSTLGKRSGWMIGFVKCARMIWFNHDHLLSLILILVKVPPLYPRFFCSGMKTLLRAKCIRSKLSLTSDSQPALCWFSSTGDETLVESFIRLGNSVDGHVSCRAAVHKVATFIEFSGEVGGRLLLSAAQSHSVSLHHRKSRTLQDHRPSWSRSEV